MQASGAACGRPRLPGTRGGRGVPQAQGGGAPCPPAPPLTPLPLLPVRPQLNCYPLARCYQNREQNVWVKVSARHRDSACAPRTPATGTQLRPAATTPLTASLPIARPAALQFTGYINAPKADTYTFTLGSNDGSRMLIDDTLLINNDGIRKGLVKVSGSRALTAGARTRLLGSAAGRHGARPRLGITTPQRRCTHLASHAHARTRPPSPARQAGTRSTSTFSSPAPAWGASRCTGSPLRLARRWWLPPSSPPRRRCPPTRSAPRAPAGPWASAAATTPRPSAPARWCPAPPAAPRLAACARWAQPQGRPCSLRTRGPGPGPWLAALLSCCAHCPPPSPAPLGHPCRTAPWAPLARVAQRPPLSARPAPTRTCAARLGATRAPPTPLPTSPAPPAAWPGEGRACSSRRQPPMLRAAAAARLLLPPPPPRGALPCSPTPRSPPPTPASNLQLFRGAEDCCGQRRRLLALEHAC